MYIYIYIQTYLYVYIESLTSAEKDPCGTSRNHYIFKTPDQPQLCGRQYIYIYIYIHIYTYIHIYIYIYTRVAYDSLQGISYA